MCLIFTRHHTNCPHIDTGVVELCEKGIYCPDVQVEWRGHSEGIEMCVVCQGNKTGEGKGVRSVATEFCKVDGVVKGPDGERRGVEYEGT